VADISGLSLPPRLISYHDVSSASLVSSILPGGWMNGLLAALAVGAVGAVAAATTMLAANLQSSIEGVSAGYVEQPRGAARSLQVIDFWAALRHALRSGGWACLGLNRAGAVAELLHP